MTILKSRILGIGRKEFLHIIHDPRSLVIIFLMPVIQLVMFGYALNLEIQRVELAVIDFNRTTYSEDLISQFGGSPFFKMFAFNGSPFEAERLFLKREARAVLIIPHDFDRKMLRRPVADVQILIDASEPNAALLIRNYCTQVVEGFNENHGTHVQMPFTAESAIWFNPQMKSAFFFVPGLLALILIMICALLTSITITREKETGTMEQILVSPIRPHEIVLGKVIPYVLISLADAGLILLIGLFLFQVPFLGSFLLFLALTTLYVITALSLGLMISTIASTQQVAMMMALVATLLPTIILSGFIFPIQAMPKALQLISNLIPAKYFLVIIRGILLKGNVFSQLVQQVLALVVMSILLLLISLRRFRLNLEG